jgi:methylated-DNA-[protein]-cysteine S-methyltransferase
MHYYGYFNSPVGGLELCVSDRGLRSIQIIHSPVAEHIPEEVIPYANQVVEYFKKERMQFSIPLDWDQTPVFHMEVLKIVQMIPYGKTRTYKKIAQFIGNPKAARAVGQANGHNPFPIVIPCHRVISEEGDLRGYAYGIEIKQMLLNFENPELFHWQIDMFEKA